MNVLGWNWPTVRWIIFGNYYRPPWYDVVEEAEAILEQAS